MRLRAPVLMNLSWFGIGISDVYLGTLLLFNGLFRSVCKNNRFYRFTCIFDRLRFSKLLAD